MKFLHEMISRKKQASVDVTEIEGPDAMDLDGFEETERAEQGQDSLDDADDWSDDWSDTRAPAAEERSAPSFMERREESYDWDVSDIDLDDEDEDVMDAVPHRMAPDPAPAAATEPDPLRIDALSGEYEGIDDDIATAALGRLNAQADDAEEQSGQRFGGMAAADDEEGDDAVDPYGLLARARERLEETAEEDDDLYVPRRPMIEPEEEPVLPKDLMADFSSEDGSEDDSDPGVTASSASPRVTSQPKIWHLDTDTTGTGDADAGVETPALRAAPLAARVAEDRMPPEPEAASASPVDPAGGGVQSQLRRRGGRVKTRLIGFNSDATVDPIRAAESHAPRSDTSFPVGWLVVVGGPGRGTPFTLHSGVSTIGRGEEQAVRLDFGDTTISRENHAVVAFDEEQNRFFLGHGGKANLVRLNDMPVLSTESLNDGDLIRIGGTTLKFVALCGAEFSWAKDGKDDAEGDRHAAGF